MPEFTPGRYWNAGSMPPSIGGFLAPSLAMGRRAQDEENARKELARLQAQVAQNQLALNAKYQAQDNHRYAQEQAAQGTVANSYLSRQGYQQDLGMQQLRGGQQMDLTRLQGGQDMQMQQLRGGQNMDLERLRGGQGMDLERLRDTLGGKRDLEKHGRDIEMKKLAFNQDLDKMGLDATLRDTIARAADERRLFSDDQAFDRQLEELKVKQGYSREDHATAFLEGESKMTDAMIADLQVKAPWFNDRAKELYGKFQNQLDKLDENRDDLTHEARLKARAKIGASMRSVPWNTMVTKKPGDAETRGDLEGSYDGNMQWKAERLRQDMTPEERKAWAESHVGLKNVDGMYIPYSLNPTGTEVKAGAPVTEGDRYGALLKQHGSGAGRDYSQPTPKDNQAAYQMATKIVQQNEMARHAAVLRKQVEAGDLNAKMILDAMKPEHYEASPAAVDAVLRRLGGQGGGMPGAGTVPPPGVGDGTVPPPVAPGGAGTPPPSVPPPAMPAGQPAGARPFGLVPGIGDEGEMSQLRNQFRDPAVQAAAPQNEAEALAMQRQTAEQDLVKLAGDLNVPDNAKQFLDKVQMMYPNAQDTDLAKMQPALREAILTAMQAEQRGRVVTPKKPSSILRRPPTEPLRGWERQ